MEKQNASFEHIDKVVAVLRGGMQAIDGVPEKLFDMLLDLWDRGTFWARTGILSLVAWFVALLLSAVTPAPYTIINTLALLPLITAVFFLCAIPNIIILLASWKKTRKFLEKLCLLLGLQLTVGLYFELVPVHNEPKLVPPMVVAGAALALFALAGDTEALIKRYGKTVAAVLVLILITFTIIFFAGGTDKVRAKFDEMSQPSNQSPAVNNGMPASAAGTSSRFSTVPVCSGETDYAPSYNDTITVMARPGCWSGVVSVPGSASYTICCGSPGSLQYLYRDGTEISSGTPLGEREGIFRITSNAGERPITVTIRSKY